MTPKTKKESTPAPSSAAAPASSAAPAKKSSSSSQNVEWTSATFVSNYVKTTPQRTKLIDLFMAYLMVVGAIQFLYCFVGSYPFNAFLSGFSATVGQFVLTASLRVQTSSASNKEFSSISPERAFADYIVCSIILHFFCVNLIN